jgi:hypothetical protein
MVGAKRFFLKCYYSPCRSLGVLETGPFFLWEAKEKQTLSVMRSVVQTDGHLQYLHYVKQLLANLITCCDHWTL